MKQGANSAVRFTSYNTLKQFLQDRKGPNKALSPVETFSAGAGAGIITVYATMPLDNIKTRMQSLNAATEYRNSFHCAARMVREEGVLSFWRGATPRLARLSVSWLSLGPPGEFCLTISLLIRCLEVSSSSCMRR